MSKRTSGSKRTQDDGHTSSDHIQASMNNLHTSNNPSAVVDTAEVLRLLKVLAGGRVATHPTKKQHAAERILEIAQGDTTNRLVLVAIGATETLTTALAFPIADDDDHNNDVYTFDAITANGKRCAVEALSKIAQEPIDAVRERAVQAGCIPIVAKLMTKVDYHPGGALLLASLADASEGNARKICCEEGLLAHLVHMLRTGATLSVSYALMAIGGVGKYRINAGAVAKHGCIVAIVEVLRTAGEKAEEKEHAAYALGNLASNKDLQEDPAWERALEPLASMLNSDYRVVKRSAAFALGNVGNITRLRKSVLRTHGHVVQNLAALLKTSGAEVKADAAYALGSFVKERDARARVRCEDVLPPLLDLLWDVNEVSMDAMETALRALSSLAGSPESKMLIRKAGAIPRLIDLLRVNKDKAKNRAARVLRALADECEPNKRIIAEAGGVPALYAIARSGPMKAAKCADAILSTLEWKCDVTEQPQVTLNSAKTSSATQPCCNANQTALSSLANAAERADNHKKRRSR